MIKQVFKKKVFALLLLALAGFTHQGFAASLEKVMEKGVLEVAFYKDFPPYSYTVKGRQMGVDIDIARELAARMSLKPSFRLVGADENVDDDLRNNIWKGHYLGGGTADVMFHMPYDRAYAAAVDQVNFISPYQLEHLVFAVDTKKIGKAPTVANFVHDPIGVELDTLSDFYLLRAVEGKIAKNVRHYKSITEAVDDLKKGDIVAVMGPKGEIEGALGKNKPDYITVQHIVTPGLSNGSWAMGLAVKATYTDLAEKINLHMVAMVEDGTIKKIFEQYGVTYAPPADSPAKK